MDARALASALECECCSRETDLLYEVLKASDEAVAKALMVSEVARIAKAEVRIREFLLQKWRIRSLQAADAAGRVVASGGTLASAAKAVDKTMARWQQDVVRQFTAHIGEVYRLARIAGHKKATGRSKASLQYHTPNFTLELETKKAAKPKPTTTFAGTVALTPLPKFDVLDKRAVATMGRQQVMWLGTHYSSNVAPVVRNAVKPAMVAGLGRVEAGKRVREEVAEKLRVFSAPTGFRGTDAKYFEGLAANVTTLARVRGQLESFARVGVTTYRIVNPMDSRTSQVCIQMNGQTFTVKEGMDQIGRLDKATTPDQVRAAHPWGSAAQVKELIGRGGGALGKAGFAFPPYHFRCRSTVDIEDSMSKVPLRPASGGGSERAPKPARAPKTPPKPRATPAPKPASKPKPKGPRAFGDETPRSKALRDAFLTNVTGSKSPSRVTRELKLGAGREALRAYMKDRYGITPGPRLAGTPLANRMRVERLGRGVRGSAFADGQVVITPSVAAQAQLEASAIKRGVADRLDSGGLQVIIHEELHQASKRNLVLSPGMRALEEASVEIGARRILNDMVPGRRGIERPAFHAATKTWITPGTGYSKYISDVLESVREVTKWPPSKVLTAVENAVLAARGRVKAADGAYEFVEQFIGKLPAMSKNDRLELGTRLRRLSGRR